MRIFHHVVVTIMLANLMGCSGSSAGGGTTPSTETHGQVLGARGVPGGTVTVSRAGPLQHGAANVFQITLSSDMPVPAEVRAWIGIAYDSTAEGIVATPVANMTASYEVSVMVSSPVGVGSHVWVRLSFADGSVVETGSADFPLVGD